MPNHDLEAYLKDLEGQTKGIKDEIFRISWYMRGGVSSDDLFHKYTYEDRLIMNQIIKDNLEATKNAKMPLI
jgi:hypothetical protein